jgi:hypothetical protein
LGGVARQCHPYLREHSLFRLTAKYTKLISLVRSSCDLWQKAEACHLRLLELKVRRPSHVTPPQVIEAAQISEAAQVMDAAQVLEAVHATWLGY